MCHWNPGTDPSSWLFPLCPRTISLSTASVLVITNRKKNKVACTLLLSLINAAADIHIEQSVIRTAAHRILNSQPSEHHSVGHWTNVRQRRRTDGDERRFSEYSGGIYSRASQRSVSRSVEVEWHSRSLRPIGDSESSIIGCFFVV